MAGPSLIATLHLLSTEDGGRRTAFTVGYRPQFSTDSPDISTSFFIERIEGKDSVAPGEIATVKATLLRPDFFEGELQAGKTFQIREGEQVSWARCDRGRYI